MTISAIVAISSNAGIGKADGSLLFRIKEDLKFFQESTKGHIVVYGRRTFDDIVRLNGGILKGRVNVVLTRNKDAVSQYGEFIFHDVESILRHSKTLNPETDKKVFICGGQDIYTQCLPHVDEVFITHINKHVEEATSFYPIELQDELGFAPVEESEEFYSEEYDAYYKFVKYTRKENELESGEDLSGQD